MSEFFSAKNILLYRLHFRLWNLIKNLDNLARVLICLWLIFGLMGIKINFRTRGVSDSWEDTQQLCQFI